MTREQIIEKANKFQKQMEEIDKKLNELNSAKMQLLGRIIELNDLLQEKEAEGKEWDFRT